MKAQAFTYDLDSIAGMLASETRSEKQNLFGIAREFRKKHSGDKVYLRGLIELSNRCSKDCYYCGLRASNKNVSRYTLDKNDVFARVKYALDHDYGSIVIQTGERSGKGFTDMIADILAETKRMSDGKMRVTLSCGEQSRDIYKKWREAGAHRYLLRIESSDPELFARIHPKNSLHSYERRVEALRDLKDLGYQTGSGVMIGLPGQTNEQLAADLLFIKEMDLDMVGMGPYLEHPDAILGWDEFPKLSPEENLEKTLLMIAVLRCIAPDINIAASTALDAIYSQGRRLAIHAGANVIMPNISPTDHLGDYLLYEGKPQIKEASSLTDLLASWAEEDGFEIGYGEAGDSVHYAQECSRS